MPDRLTSLDVTFLRSERSENPMHVGTVDLFAPSEAGGAGSAGGARTRDGFDYEHLIGLIRDRIALVPRYRQRLARMPGRLVAPVWTDDEDFDITFHVRRSALPRPGTPAQLRELVGRIMSRRLDTDRPLWEMYLVEGLSDGRFAVLTKCHQALIDGIDHVDIGQVVFDTSPAHADPPADDWTPRRPPNPVEAATGVVTDVLRGPASTVEVLRGALAGLTGANNLREAVDGLVGTVVAGQHNAASPLHVRTSPQRRFETVDTPLADYRRIRAAHDCTVNDVVLAVVTGALRGWFLTRGESLRPTTVVRAVVPMSSRDDDPDQSSLGSHVDASRLTLPVGETSPVMRLHQVAYANRAHKNTEHAVGARSLASIAGFAPATLHTLAARVTAATLRSADDLLVTNVPGPQSALYAAGARLVESYPVLPVPVGRALSIGATSYDGRVFFGLYADRHAVGDVGVLAQCLRDALDELLVATDAEAAG